MSRIRTTVWICGLAVALCSCAPRPEAERTANVDENVAVLLPDEPVDAAIATAEPTMAHTIFANDWVAAARVTIEPGQLIPPHDAGTRFVYPLSKCTLSVIDDGTEEVVDLEPGELETWSAGRLGLANVEGSTGDLLVVERSAVETLPDLDEVAVPDDSVDMERHGTVLMDDNDVLAVDISLADLETDPLAPDLPTLIVSLSDCDLEFEGAAVPDVEEIMKNGEAVWLDAGYNTVTNVGGNEAHVLTLAFRR